jgi:SGNH domain-containing protein
VTRRIATALAAVLAAAIGVAVADAGERAVPTPACFGAAARDPRAPCVNHALSRTAIPSPYAAPLEPSEPCERIERAAPPACAFGTPRRTARTSVALLGDSHSTHWRAALAFLARRRQWHGVSINRNLCPFTLARTNHHDRCKGWTRGVLRWLRNHPEVRAAFVSANAGSGIQPVPGQRRQDTKVDGYLRAWGAMPSSVREIFVLRDVPHSAGDTAECVSAAVARRRNPALRCARPRAKALVRDLEAEAAALDQTGRVKLVDLTTLMCDEQSCPPVVGGALVIKDIGHMTRTFSRTLGPFLGRAVDALRRTRASAARDRTSSTRPQRSPARPVASSAAWAASPR